MYDKPCSYWKNYQRSSKISRNRFGNTKCYKCNQFGHISFSCPKLQNFTRNISSLTWKQLYQTRQILLELHQQFNDHDTTSESRYEVRESSVPENEDGTHDEGNLVDGLRNTIHNDYFEENNFLKGIETFALLSYRDCLFSKRMLCFHPFSLHTA